MILPLKPDLRSPFRPHNESSHAFRGLVCTAPRPSYLAAQMLVHEMTHNKMSSILDLFELFKNSESESFYSPFVNAERPLANLFHGVASFLNDVCISEKIHGKVQEFPEAPILKYIRKNLDRIDQALETIQKQAVLTESGQSVLQGFLLHRESLICG